VEENEARLLHGKGEGICKSRLRNCVRKRAKRWPNGVQRGLGASFPRPSRVAGLRDKRREVRCGKRVEWEWSFLEAGEREREEEGCCGCVWLLWFPGLLEREFLHEAGERVAGDKGPSPERREPAGRARAGTSSVPHAGGTPRSGRAEGRRETGKSQLPFSLVLFMGLCK